MNEDTPPERRRMVKPPVAGKGSGRGLGHTAVKTARFRTQSSAKWLERQLNDPYVVKAKAEGWRSRAAFKLMEIDDRFHLLKRGARVVDLGCAPGGWVQVALKRGADFAGLARERPELTVVFVTHRLATLGAADRVAWITGGVIQAYGTLAELAAHTGFQAFLASAATASESA